MKPDVSIIMSVYNGELYLREAIESILHQTMQNWELIVINDCSTDSTAEILAEFAEREERIKVHPNEVNLRLPTSLNKAISLASGRYIARMDADDISLPTRLEQQVRFMDAHPDVDLSSCRFMTMKNGVYASGGAGGRCDDDALRAMLLVANPILHPGVIAKADVMKAFPYDKNHTCTEDLELWTRMAMAGKTLAILPECLLLYRLHDKQITSTTLERQRTEVLTVQDKYYAAFAEVMDAETKHFYIDGVYFRTKAEIKPFLTYAKWLRNGTKQTLPKNAVNYALLEVLAEYKRRGVKKADVIKGMLTFPPCFLMRELRRRKRAANTDIAKCRAVAEGLGLRQTSGSEEYPIYESESQVASK